MYSEARQSAEVDPTLSVDCRFALHVPSHSTGNNMYCCEPICKPQEFPGYSRLPHQRKRTTAKRPKSSCVVV